MRARVREIIRQACAEMGVHIVKGVLVRDHGPMFISVPPPLPGPPILGARTFSLRPGDKTMLRENMTPHSMIGLWMEDWGFEITESIRIGKSGPECLDDMPRKMVVKASPDAVSWRACRERPGGLSEMGEEMGGKPPMRAAVAPGHIYIC